MFFNMISEKLSFSTCLAILFQYQIKMAGQCYLWGIEKYHLLTLIQSDTSYIIVFLISTSLSMLDQYQKLYWIHVKDLITKQC